MSAIKFGGLQVAATGIAIAVLVPLVVVLSSVFIDTGDIWRHLVDNVLAELIRNTAWLVAGVVVGTAVIGVSLAWFTSMYEFPGRRFFVWALMLPLALPSYVLAFVAVGLLDFTGPVQSTLRVWFDGGVPWFPRIRSTGGVIAVMTLALYPYVYLIVRNAFLSQGARALEVAQSLGLSRTRAFFKLILPMSRPWIVAGLLLVAMETLADFGAVAIFNYDTFTTAIYKTWYGLFSLAAAAQLASVLMLAVLAVLLSDTFARKRLRYHAPGRHSIAPRIQPQRPQAWFMTAVCAGVLLIAFVIPFAQILHWAYGVWAQDLDLRYLSFLWHSLALGILAALATACAALVLAYAQRRRGDTYTRVTVRVATLGYAVPGAVLAVGIFIPLAAFDRLGVAVLEYFGMTGMTGILQGSLAAMILAYTIRFLAAGFGAVESALQRVTPSIEEAARGFGLSAWRTWTRVHLPLLRRGLATAAILVFVDVLKEMPITLMTRPFGWDTMAVRIFEMTSEGEWQRAALPAAAIVLVSLVSIVILMRQQDRL